jgi:hypothetical protein
VVRIARMLRDAGSLKGLLALWGAVDKTALLTKARAGTSWSTRPLNTDRMP